MMSIGKITWILEAILVSVQCISEVASVVLIIISDSWQWHFQDAVVSCDILGNVCCLVMVLMA